jgi:site-specific recombinase XerD
VDREVQRLDDHLRATCGLREATRTYRRRYVREFLRETFGDGAVEHSRITAPKVIQFLSRRAADLRPGSAQVVASSLRSYFGFLQLEGAGDEALGLAVPRAANWKLAVLPKVLTDKEVACLLDIFDRTTTSGLRDYAVTRCLLDLGLRAIEVAGLHLDDVNWRAGTLRIVGSKSRRDDQLPLAAPLGRALVAYLRRGRPHTSSRQLFLRLRAPVGQGMTARTVCSLISRAGARANLSAVLTGPRVLRHTAATRMLRGGASLKEVADVLRHRCLDTTAIYAKVDLSRLAAVALPWPEASS